MRKEDGILFSGGAPGAESAFGEEAEKHGVEEVNFTFEGHTIARHRGLRVLNHEELLAGDVSLEYVSRLMNRRYTEGPTLRKILQTIWYQVNHGQEIYVVGTILDDVTVRGGTGWGAEFAKLCNKPLHVFDQDQDAWFSWSGSSWTRRARRRRARHRAHSHHGHRALACSSPTAARPSRRCSTAPSADRSNVAAVVARLPVPAGRSQAEGVARLVSQHSRN